MIYANFDPQDFWKKVVFFVPSLIEKCLIPAPPDAANDE